MFTVQAPPTSAPVTRRTVAPVGAAVPAPGERGHLHHALVAAIRTRHYSRRTEQAYWHWTRHFVLWSGKRHPNDMGAPEIGAFLTRLAAERGMTLIPPYDHAHVMAGQGTAAAELIEETGPLDLLLVGVGGATK